MEFNELKKTTDEVIDIPFMFDDKDEPSVGFKVVGANSEQYQQAEREWQLTQYRKNARRGRGIDASTKSGAEELAELVRRQERMLAKACVVDWYGFTEGGVPMELNEKNLDRVFEAKPLWVARILTEVRAERLFP